MKQKNPQLPQFVFRLDFAILVAIVWSIVFFFIWKPAIILAVIWIAGFAAPHLRKNLTFSHNYIRPVITGLLWGGVLGSLIFFLNTFGHAPLWWAIGTYILGFLVAGYISYGHLVGIEALAGEKLEAYHLVSLAISIVAYFSSILLLFCFILKR